MRKCLRECLLNGTLNHNNLSILPIITTRYRETLEQQLLLVTERHSNNNYYSQTHQAPQRDTLKR